MIQCRLRELLAIKSRKDQRRVTYRDIQAATGISRNTLVKLANDKANLVGVSVMNRLCSFFECTPGELFVYMPEVMAK